MSYPYPASNSYRASCTNVVDGDTYDLLVDTGFYAYHQGRFRLLGVNAPELNDPDPAIRATAQAAKAFCISKLVPGPQSTNGPWTLRIVTQKADHFGRFLAEVFYMENGVEKSLADELLHAGLAVVYP